MTDMCLHTNTMIKTLLNLAKVGQRLSHEKSAILNQDFKNLAYIPHIIFDRFGDKNKWKLHVQARHAKSKNVEM